MKILVPCKRVIDPYVKIRINSAGSAVETANVKMAINPFDEIAIEEAIRLKEKGLATEVQLVSIGNKKTQESLRAGLALGADSAIHILSEQELECLSVAKVLATVVQQQNAELVIMGKQAIDNDNNQTGQMLAALLGWPQATFVSDLVINEGKAIATREVDGGLETLSLQLPAVITTDLRLNEPRYAALPNIMKAKSKPLEEIDITDLGIELHSHINVEKVESPASRSAGVKVESAKELVAKLKEEKVI